MASPLWVPKLHVLNEFLETFIKEAELQKQASINSSSSLEDVVELTTSHSEKIFSLTKDLITSLCIYFPQSFLFNKVNVAPWEVTLSLDQHDSSLLFRCCTLLFHCVFKYPSSKNSKSLHSPDFIRLFHFLSMIISTFPQNPSALATLLRKSQVQFDPETPSSAALYSISFTALNRIKSYFMNLQPLPPFTKDNPDNPSSILYHFLEYILLLHQFLRFLSISGELDYPPAVLQEFINIPLPPQVFPILPFLAFELSMSVSSFSHSTKTDHKGLVIYLVDLIKHIAPARQILLNFLQSLESSFTHIPGFLPFNIVKNIHSNDSSFSQYLSLIEPIDSEPQTPLIPLDGISSQSLFLTSSIIRSTGNPSLSKETLSHISTEFQPFTRHHSPLSFSPITSTYRP